MKTISIFLTIFLFSTVSIKAQNFEWAKSFGGIDDDIGNCIDIDAQGNIYTAGEYRSTVDFDPGQGIASLTAAGTYDVFVQKLDATGNFLWARSFGGSGSDRPYSICVDDSGNIYTTGFFYGTADFDPGTGTYYLTSVGANDIFVHKMDSSGNFLWVRSFGGTSADNGRSITVDNSGGVYITGQYYGTVDFDPGQGNYLLTPEGYCDVFVLKMNASGTFLWAKSFGGAQSNEYCFSINIDAFGNVFTTGYFFGSTDFDPGAGTYIVTSAGASDIFIHKMDSLGNFLWVNTFGGSSSDAGTAISTDSYGNVFATGSFRGTVDFNPGPGIYYLYASVGNTFVNKLDSAGNFLWAKTFTTTSYNYGTSIITDTFNDVYTIGIFKDTADFDPGANTANHISVGYDDVFIQKMDAFGNFLWAKSFGGTFDDNINSICVDASGNVLTTGSFGGLVDFDPGVGTSNLNSAGTEDVFIHKMSQCFPVFGVDVVTACDKYTWIDGTTYTSSNYTTNFTLTNPLGCDSIVTLNLTINSVSDTTTTLNGNRIFANNSNATYQWLDCENSFSPIVGDTFQSFTANQNGSYAVELTENGCIDTSACVVINNVGIVENNFNGNFSVSPNPNNGNFVVDLGNVYQNTYIKIADITGKIIDNKCFTKTQFLNLTINAPAGVYFLSINSEINNDVVKIVIK